MERGLNQFEVLFVTLTAVDMISIVFLSSQRLEGGYGLFDCAVGGIDHGTALK